jgi:hypothetical protein
MGKQALVLGGGQSVEKMVLSGTMRFSHKPYPEASGNAESDPLTILAADKVRDATAESVFWPIHRTT